MSDPFTIFSALSAAVSAVSSISSGNAESAQENANASAAQANAVETGRLLASNDATAERQQRAMTGEITTKVAANGLTLSGSALDVTLNDLYESELQKLQDRRSTAMQRENYLYEASAAKARAKQAKTAGYLGAAGAVVGSAANLLSTGGSQGINLGQGIRTGVRTGVTGIKTGGRI